MTLKRGKNKSCPFLPILKINKIIVLKKTNINNFKSF